MSAHAWAGQQAEPQGAARPVLHAVRLAREDKIDVDGRLDEAAWSRAEPATNFRQFDPHNGEPSTERTEIRIVFDEDNLYIGGQFFDSNTNGLLGNQMVRDGPLNADDRFIWVLDPFNDLRSGYYFEVNPGGAMGDAQLVPAQGTSGIGVTQNRAWDGIWLARVQRHDQGWSVEVQIPFRTLNFDPQGHVWGANFQRTVRRKNEETFWSGWGRNQGIYSLTSAGQIDGISDVSQGHGLDIKPHVIGTYGDTPGTSALYKKNAGIDFFYNLTPQMKTNLTVNTDFAQTEVDDRQVNLTRFPLFFPEKRDFFLDGSGNFDFSREAASNMSAFFTRRIGLDDVTGEPQKIDYGLKLGGRAGQYNLGLLHVRTGDQRKAFGEEFTVFRPKRLFFAQSYVGLIYTRRATRDSITPDRQSIGADFQLSTARLRGDQNIRLAAFLLKTPNPARKGHDLGWGARIDYPNDRWDAQLGYKYIERNFDPAIGFVEQSEYRKWTEALSFSPRPKNNRWIRQVTVGARAELYTNMAGRWTQRVVTVTPLRVDLQSGDEAFFTIEPDYDFLEEDFRIRTGSGTITLPRNNDYSYTRYAFRVNTANRRRISGSGSTSVGTFFSGRRRDVSMTLNLRPRPGFLATLTSTFNHVELNEGSFSTRIVRGIVNTQFSPFISVSQNIQYDSVSHVLGWQTRFRWIVKPGDDMYFVYLNNWIDTDQRLTTLNRSGAVKMVYTYRF